MKKSDHIILQTLKKKAAKSSCTYRISAIAFDAKGDVLGTAVNSHADWNVIEKDGIGREGTAKHAERKLMAQYSENIKSIIICRIGHGGALRPIDPCPVCAKAAKKLGITITTVRED